MAVNDVLWLGGQPRLAKSTGTTATVVWLGGQPVITHEYSTGTVDNLTVNDMLLSAALLDSPALGQTHVLTINDMLLPGALIDNPALTVIHSLGVNDFLLAEILLDSPTLGITHVMTISDLLLAETLLDSPSLSQIHELSINDFLLAEILLDSPALGSIGDRVGRLTADLVSVILKPTPVRIAGVSAVPLPGITSYPDVVPKVSPKVLSPPKISVVADGR